MNISKPYLLIFNGASSQMLHGKQLRQVFRASQILHNGNKTGELLWSWEGLHYDWYRDALPTAAERDGDCWLSEEEFAKFQADNIELFL